MQAGRTLQRIEKNKQSFIMANEFLEGTDGRKMSKSWGNAIWLTDEPSDMYGKVMSLKDDLIVQYFLLGTNVPTTTVEQVKKRLEDGENPMNLKKELAFEIVKELHSQEDARKAQEAFENVFSKGETPEHIEEIEIESGSNLLDVLVEHMLVISKSEAKRLIEQGGIKADGQPVDMNFQLTSDIILQIGKRKFVKISKK
jgi:tyrosyl-tRNA synthetase